MKEFLKMTTASIIGMLIAGVILFFLSIGALAGMAGAMMSTETETIVKDNSVFVLDLKGNIVERYEDNPFDQFFSEEITTRGLDDIISSIKKAKENPKIKGILLNAEIVSCATASLQEIRNALVDSKVQANS